MITEILIFTFYFCLFTFLVTRIRFFTNSGLSKKLIAFIFITKIIGGFAYYAFYNLPQYRNSSDTLEFYKLSLTETQTLLHNPWQFVKELFTNTYQQGGNGIFSGVNSFWNDLKTNAFTKLTAVFNVLTFKSYLTNIILFNFLFYFGMMGLYRALQALTPHKKLLLCCVFFIPGVWFYCSGIHKDGLILSAIGMTIFAFQRGLQNGCKLKHVIAILLSLLLLFAFRNYVALAMGLTLFVWFISTKTKKPAIAFGLFALAGLTGFIASMYLPGSLNLAAFLASKQNEFQLLEGDSQFTNGILQPTPASFAGYLPVALDAVFLQPHLSFKSIATTLPFFAENIVLLVLILAAILSKQKTQKPAIIYACLFFCCILIFITGYTVTFAGAIVRYKTIYLPVLAGVLIMCIDWKGFMASLHYVGNALFGYWSNKH